MNNTRQILLIRVLAFLFTLVSCFVLYEKVQNQSYDEMIGPLGILFLAGFTLWYMGRSSEERKEPDSFIKQLQENKGTINSQGWMYGENLIKPDTEITQFFFTFSLITVSFKIPSRFYIVGEENTALINIIYSVLSFILGWWAIPVGPFYTISSLTNNLKGGRKMVVSEVIGA